MLKRCNLLRIINNTNFKTNGIIYNDSRNNLKLINIFWFVLKFSLKRPCFFSFFGYIVFSQIFCRISDNVNNKVTTNLNCSMPILCCCINTKKNWKYYELNKVLEKDDCQLLASFALLSVAFIKHKNKREKIYSFCVLKNGMGRNLNIRIYLGK